MWNFQRIICIWICCVSCMFGTTQLSSLVRAVPYEYFDDHEQSFYDLDAEQIQAKYDTRLLSQQMLQTEQQQQQHLENLKGFNVPESGRSLNDGATATKTKLQSNVGHTMNAGADIEEDDDEHNDWLEETATKAAAFSTTITETLDELHLPRAASCFTNGQKFTHGQKVPRLDNCEVCLCMDGEIFCWWEICDKKATKASTTFDDYSTPSEESSTIRIQLNPKTTFKTTLKPMKNIKTSEDYKYDDDVAAEIRQMQHEYEGLRDQLLMKKKLEAEQHENHLNKQIMVKKKLYLQKENTKYNRKINEHKKNKQNKKKEDEQLQKLHKPNKNNEQHHHTYNHNINRNNDHEDGSSSASSKILNFPENLPSVLYYDYKTEEHHQHQHQHHEQHLKHQKQKQQQQLLLRQHEKELKHQQQNLVNRHHEYGQDFNTYIGSGSKVDKTLSADKITGSKAEAETETKHHTRSDGSSTTFKYFSSGNENIYNEDLQTDSDILPEPPTKKPKLLTSMADTTATEKTTHIPISQFNRFSTLLMPTTNDLKTNTTTTTSTLTNTSATETISLKKKIFSPWDHNRPNRDKTNSNDNNGNGSNNKYKNNKSSEDILETDDKDIADDDDGDDAFHRWLTSTETNNKNNFTLNDAVIGRDDLDGDGILNGNKSNYNGDERNYENMDAKRNIGKTVIMKEDTATTTTALNTFNMFEQAEDKAVEIISDENIPKPKYEQNFNEIKNKGIKGIIYDTDNTNNNKDAPDHINSFSLGTKASSSAAISSTTTSNEENGVASVVNIDIMLTASSADLQQQPQDTHTKTTNEQRQLQQQDFEHENQKFIQSPVLISNTNDVDNKNTLYSIINDNNSNFSAGSNKRNTTNMTGDALNMEEERTQLQNVGVNLSSSNNKYNNNSANSQNLSRSSDSFKFKHRTEVVSQTNTTSAAATPPLSTTLSPERQCNVMGTLYKIGDVLPQDTGNCLQCICIDGSTSDDTPRVTCSPHNCPPLVLPDLFDATGY